MLLPTLNRSDLLDIPEELRKDLEFVFVDRIEEVLLHVMYDVPSSQS